MLKEFKRIPKTKFASKIEENGELKQLNKTSYKYTNKVGAITELVEFTCKEDQVPEPGDYIVQNDDGNTYYLADKEDWEAEYQSQGFCLI